MPQRIFWMKVFAILWLITVSVLFFLPGSALPQDGLFNFPYLDKLVHFVFFVLLIYLWRFFIKSSVAFSWLLLALSFVYGLGVELIQHYFIAFRSFDVADIVADMAGAVVGLLFWTKRYIKK